MTDYIVCHKKRNTPRINIRICRERCPSKMKCKDFLAWAHAAKIREAVLPVTENAPGQAAAAG